MSSSSGSKIRPALLIVIVVLAVAFFVSGLVHVLFRFVFRKRRRSPPPQDGGGGESSVPDRRLQQLFHQHDSGLDQAFIDALPVFLYADLVAAKEEPFDCAVCLCEFDAATGDELRLLPVCGHAFHLACIDTWLLSNSTCPLCRGSLFPQRSSIEHIAFNFSDRTQDDEEAAGEPHACAVEETAAVKAFPVRLGKFRNLGDGHGDTEGTTHGDSSGRIVMKNWRFKEGESSSNSRRLSLDARRCFSMGSYQYVVADAELHVAFKNCCSSANRGREVIGADEAAEGKRLGVGCRRESFSVSKIWLWSNNKEKTLYSNTSDLEASSPWKKIKANW
ncbi:RING-H2 finger protein ATL46-like [Zingiber officinale]|uniref:RING-type E3 ubiquitin transferase n=1 Tax=Zingiber officinale TaxID=94328 RepID=A0A8J5L1V8_ZINOF|nr:RING-H2 finger protein ATL46-like [Zingiber officinale]KAG6502047.1 hypothetical protein ZIOFF_041934 [Zingiber officinale]